MPTLSDSIYQRHERYISPNFVKLLQILGFNKVFTRANDVELFDENGKAFLDLLSGFGSINLGYNHPELQKALQESLLTHPPAFLHIAPQIPAGTLAESLAKRLGESLSVSFFCNSGAEAVEGALKLAYRATRRKQVLSCRNSYHGLTLGALSLMGKKKFQKSVPALPGCVQIPFGDIDAAEKQLRCQKFAAFIIEPIQIEGGIQMPPPGYLSAISSLCQRYKTTLIFDEVQTGMGRTGYLFSFQKFHVSPDILVYAKGFSGGLLPIGGFSTSPDWYRRAYPNTADHGIHESTFGGNALCCIVANKTLSLLDEEFLQQVRKTEEFLAVSLKKLSKDTSCIAHVRGVGLIWGLEFSVPTYGVKTLLSLEIPNMVSRRLFGHWIAVRLLEKGFVTETTTHNENVLRIEPALTISQKALTRFLEALREVLLENDSFLRFVRQAGTRLIQKRFFA